MKTGVNEAHNAIYAKSDSITSVFQAIWYDDAGDDSVMLFKREKYLKKIRPFYSSDDIIKVITGVRRCGKSSLMQMIADELRQNGVKDDDIIYLDLDERKNRKIKTPDQLEALIESERLDDGHKYLFIDEVQNVEGFEEVLNGYRTDGGFSIFITGSNSYLLRGNW